MYTELDWVPSRRTEAKTVDLVTVFHNDKNRGQAKQLYEELVRQEGHIFEMTAVDNRETNRGYGPACNLGARAGSSPYVGFLNPDLEVDGPFLKQVVAAFADPKVLIAGSRFGKPQADLYMWGCKEWVCGACMFVHRGWFDNVGGFDEQFYWGWEETDLIRRVQQRRGEVRALELPVRHHSPADDSPEDAEYKRRGFRAGRDHFVLKYGPLRRRRPDNRRNVR